MKKVLCSLATVIFLMISASTILAGAFVQDSFGLKYDVGGGRYLENGWAWCDPTGTGIGYSYYFSPTGYILVNTIAPDGNQIDAAGRMTVNGVVMTKIIEKGGYELNTASYLAEPVQQNVPINTSLANRISQCNNATVTSFNYGIYTCADAIEFTEGYNPYIMFNTGNNRSLTFDLTGDNLDYDGDFVVDVYIDGAFRERFSQRFVDLTTRTISFDPNQTVEIRVPIINDYYEQYIRRVYIINSYFG